MWLQVCALILFHCWGLGLSALIATPFGLRPEECVREVPHGSVVSEHDGRLRVVHPLLGETWHEVPAVCHEEQYKPAQRSAGRSQPDWGQRCDVDPTPRACFCDEPPCTCKSLPCDSWIDNAGLWTHPQQLGGFSSMYTVPETPPAGAQGQTLFWFIGAENTDGLPRHGQPAGGRTILQPVLTYNPSGWCAGKSKNGWCFSSWNCCPANVTTHSPYIFDVLPGDKFLGYFNLTRHGVYEVVSKNMRTGEVTSLEADSPGWFFDWADVTLEIYGVKKCSDFAAGAATFSEMKLWDIDRKQIAKNKWLLTSEKPCRGTIKNIAQQSITIEHKPAEEILEV